MFGGKCSDVQVISENTECPVACDTNHVESVTAVRCISAGVLDNASPRCTGNVD